MLLKRINTLPCFTFMLENHQNIIHLNGNTKISSTIILEPFF